MSLGALTPRDLALLRYEYDPELGLPAAPGFSHVAGRARRVAEVVVRPLTDDHEPTGAADDIGENRRRTVGAAEQDFGAAGVGGICVA